MDPPIYLLIQDSIGSVETDDLPHQPNETDVMKKTTCSEKTRRRTYTTRDSDQGVCVCVCVRASE